jgi:hypothetical protein
VEGRAERSVDDLLREAEQVASGDIAAGEFAANLDWALPGIAKAGGEYAPHIVSMITDATDELAVGRGELNPEAARALAAAAELAARRGQQAESVAKAHEHLVNAGLRPPGAPPEPWPREVIRGARPVVAATAPGERPEHDPAIDPSVADLARRVSPSRSSLQPFRVLGMGWAIVLSIVFGLLGGLWLDGRFGTSPLLTVVGLVLGLGLAWSVVRNLLAETRRR